MLSRENSQMEYSAELRYFIRSLDAAQDVLREAANSHPGLKVPSRALGRVAKVMQRPFRLAILGEANSGKTSLANLIVGGMTLPALPVANTRLPTLLRYAPVPGAGALYASGETFPLSVSDDVSSHAIIRVDVGLPSEILRRIEILDFPGSANPLFPSALSAVLMHGIDAAIWATVATQAWRESERTAWLGLPRRIRSYGVLAVTHSDLISTEEDFRRLRTRLETAAKPHFQGMCFVAAPVNSPEHVNTSGLVSQIWQLVEQFSANRLSKAVLVTRRLARQTLERLGPETESH
ncbi:MAG: hypothetical protein ACLP7P_08825 [Rhodomicrobium sp.]